MRMVEAAERDGRLAPAARSSSRRRATPAPGLAIAARLKGYRVIAVMPDKMSREKIDLLRAYGAEVVVMPDRRRPGLAAVLLPRRRPADEGDPGRVPAQPVREPGQPGDALPDAPGRSCGASPAGRSRTSCAASAPAGRSPASRSYLKEQNPKIEVIGADPVGSIYSNEEVHPYLVEGVGEDFWPATYDPSVVDRYVTVSDRDAFLTTRRLAETEGLLVGGSCGLAMHAALEVAASIKDPDAMVAVILPDGGRGYLSKIFNDEWMTQYGFLERSGEHTVGDVLRMKTAAGEIPPFVVVQTAPARARRDHAAARAPRVAAAGGVAPTIRTRSSARSASAGCSRHAMSDPQVMDARDRDVMEAPFTRRLDRRPGARGGRAADRRHAGADRVRARPAGRDRHPHRPARVARLMSASRRRRCTPGWSPTRRSATSIPAIHQSTTYVQAAPGRVRRGLRLLALGQPDARGAGARAGRARGRARRARSRPAWPPSTR